MDNTPFLTINFFPAEAMSPKMAEIIMDISMLYRLSGGTELGFDESISDLPAELAATLPGTSNKVFSASLLPVNVAEDAMFDEFLQRLQPIAQEINEQGANKEYKVSPAQLKELNKVNQRLQEIAKTINNSPDKSLPDIASNEPELFNEACAVLKLKAQLLNMEEAIVCIINTAA